MRHARGRYNRGSVPEVVDDGLTGFIVEETKISAVARSSASRS